jgi:hypothetical protein
MILILGRQIFSPRFVNAMFLVTSHFVNQMKKKKSFVLCRG